MKTNYIEFKKQRDFGLLISDTFNFLRNEFKPFLKTIFKISGPAIVLYLIAMAFYMQVAGDFMNFDIYNTNSEDFSDPILILFAALCYIVSLMITFILVSSSSLHYIKSYIENKGQINYEDIRRNVSSTFWSYFGLGFIKWITLLFSVLLCVFPVLYVMVPMFIVFSIYVFEKKRNAIDAYSHSFYLINEDFWTAIGTMIVIFIIIYIISMVFSVPTLIYTYAKMGILSGEFDPESINTIVDPVYIVLNVISNLFSILLNLIPIVASAFIYFHLNEKRNFTGTYERISNIGNTEI